MNTRTRSNMPHPAPAYRTPMPTPEINQDGILHPALTPRRRRTINGLSEPIHRAPSFRQAARALPSRERETEETRAREVRPKALPGYAPASTPSDRASDDRLFEDLVANAADSSHTRARDDIEADFIESEFETEKTERSVFDELEAEDDEEGRKPEYPAD